MLILISMALFIGQILGTLLMEFWIGPWIEKRANKSDRSDGRGK